MVPYTRWLIFPSSPDYIELVQVAYISNLGYYIVGVQPAKFGDSNCKDSPIHKAPSCYAFWNTKCLNIDFAFWNTKCPNIDSDFPKWITFSYDMKGLEWQECLHNGVIVL